VRRVHIPDHVRYSAAYHGGVVLVNVLSGQCYAMNPTADVMWRAWRAGGDFETAIAATAAHHPELSCDRIRRDARHLVGALAGRDLVVLDRDVPRRARTGLETEPLDRAQVPVETVANSRRRAVIPIALGLSLLLTCLPFRFTVRVTRATRRRCRRSATPREVTATITAVRRAAGWWPGRVACLELSLATVTAMTLTRCRADLVIGVADDPCRFHAWVEVDGVPVQTESDPAIDEFRRILII
jgi:transglutaminase superfamily protein/coenzyme PQQ synthesis protein D (PqqD)